MKYLLLLLSLVPGLALSQKVSNTNIRQFVTVDSISHKGIPGALVEISGKKHFITDNNGSVNLSNELIGLADTIKISSIGYQTKKISYPIDSKPVYSISLSPSITTLTEVVVSAKRSIKIGDFKKKYNSHRSGGPNSICAQYIPNDKKITGIITSIEYVINNDMQGIERPFKVGLYTKSKDNIFPDQNLLQDSVIIVNPEKKTHIIVDVSKYQIPFPENGVMVFFQTLPAQYYDSVYANGFKYSKVPCIDMDLKKKNYFTYDPEDKDDRQSTYALVMDTEDEFTVDSIKRQAYVYKDGNNFAISITVE